METPRQTGHTQAWVFSRTHLNTALVQSEPHLKPSALRIDRSGWRGLPLPALSPKLKLPVCQVLGHLSRPWSRGASTEGSPPTGLSQETRPRCPKATGPVGTQQVPEHLADVADTQVDDLECIISGTTEQMQLVVAEAQGGDPTLHRDDLGAAGPPEEQERRRG